MNHHKPPEQPQDLHPATNPAGTSKSSEPQDLHRAPPRKKKRRHRVTPARAGTLIDLHTAIQKGHAVIDNFSLSSEEQALLMEENTERQATAHEYANHLKLPTWDRLNDNLKQVFRIASHGSHPHAVALSCNLSPKTATRALKAKKGSAYYVARIIKRVLTMAGLSPDMAITMELAHGRNSKNPELHIHGVIQVPPSLRDRITADLKQALASDYREVASNKAVLLKPINNPGGWAYYCVNQRKYTLDYLENPDFATHAACRTGRALYDETRTWLQALPPLEQPLESRESPPVPRAMTPAGLALIGLIEAHRALLTTRRELRRQRRKEIKQEFLEDPIGFRQKTLAGLQRRIYGTPTDLGFTAAPEYVREPPLQTHAESPYKPLQDTPERNGYTGSKKSNKALTGAYRAPGENPAFDDRKLSLADLGDDLNPAPKEEDDDQFWADLTAELLEAEDQKESVAEPPLDYTPDPKPYKPSPNHWHPLRQTLIEMAKERTQNLDDSYYENRSMSEIYQIILERPKPSAAEHYRGLSLSDPDEFERTPEDDEFDLLLASLWEDDPETENPVDERNTKQSHVDIVDFVLSGSSQETVPEEKSLKDAPVYSDD
ncbi:hypothetical protein HA520_01040 [Azotobacter chroococcum]|uniref:Replication protein n=1 Tax=Azotobacter chroococcum TaxID=353 RepID=A0AA43Z2T8_9GAMM|nr:hypothetical protein [Azotobacter chroococcum]NHN75880.1 hypothetical protein [Azotobacter chroococcum]